MAELTKISSNDDSLKMSTGTNGSKVSLGVGPKYGTLVPNRIYVGGISSDTTESDLSRTFAAYGNVVSSKIIMDRSGVSKGYGFVTFSTDEEAKRLQADLGSIILKNRTLSIAPAIKKPAFAKYAGGANNYIARPGATITALPLGYQPAPDMQPNVFYPYAMQYQHPYMQWMPMEDQHTAAAWPDNYHGIYHY